jgi:hypothetical protein
MMPLKELKTESKIIACNGISSSPFGAGILLITAFNISLIPKPVLPDAGITSFGSQPIN